MEVRAHEGPQLEQSGLARLHDLDYLPRSVQESPLTPKLNSFRSDTGTILSKLVEDLFFRFMDK